MKSVQVQQDVISNTQLKDVKELYMISNYPYTWTIRNRTPVEPMPDKTMPNLPPFLRLFKCPYLYKIADKEADIDMKGLVIHQFPTIVQANNKTLKIYAMIDEEKIPVVLRLWCENEKEDEHEVIGLDNRPVYIVATDLRVATFNGLSLNSRYSTLLLHDVPVEGKKNCNIGMIKTTMMLMNGKDGRYTEKQEDSSCCRWRKKF